jgi:DNA-directed RNA polymerases I and III subunit RPAC1
LISIQFAYPFTLTAASDQATDRNTLVFRLAVACTRNKLPAADTTTDPAKLYTNSEVLSSHLEWQPQGEQAVVFADNPPAPTNPNIVLVKLRPGQEVEMEMHAVKGVGKDHAKFSPVGQSCCSLRCIGRAKCHFVYVATASYRILPLIILNPEKPVPAHLATKFQNCFAQGVIRIDPRTSQVSVDEKGMRKDTVSREVLRHPEFEGCVALKRVRDFFLCEFQRFISVLRVLMDGLRQSILNQNHSTHLNGSSLSRSE